MTRAAEPPLGAVLVGVVAVAVCCGLPIAVAAAVALGVWSGVWLLAAVAGIVGAGLGWWWHRRSCQAEPTNDASHVMLEDSRDRN